MSNKVNNFYVPKLKEVGAWFELRDDSKGAKDWRGYRSLSGIVAVAGHHTVTHPTGNAEQEVATIWQIHKQRGFGGIGYNAIITSEEVNGYAKVYLIGDIGSIRAHTPNSKGFRGWRAQYGNYYLLGFSFIGMNHLVEPTDAQYRSAHELVKEFIYNENVRLPNLKTWNDLVIHWDCDATACWGSKVDKNKIINPPKLNLEDPKMIEDLQNQIKALNTSITTLQTEKRALESSLETRDKKILSQQGEIKGLKEDIEELRQKIAEFDTEEIVRLGKELNRIRLENIDIVKQLNHIKKHPLFWVLELHDSIVKKFKKEEEKDVVETKEEVK
jgi:polyhydroxyalkanoate synthesis regulator phasin